MSSTILMKCCNRTLQSLGGETQGPLQKSNFCPMAAAADVGIVSIINNVCEGYGIELHTFSAHHNQILPLRVMTN